MQITVFRLAVPVKDWRLLKEQQAIVEHVCQLAPGVPLMVASGMNLKQQIAWVEYCNQLPIHGCLVRFTSVCKTWVVGQYIAESLLTQVTTLCVA